MLDVHPPHEAAHTWKDFFIHIATIVVGLCIAVGLEQMVQFFHHKHEVRSTRKELRQERQENHRQLRIETAAWRVEVAALKNNMLVLQYLQQHPGTPEEKLPGTLVWGQQSAIFVHTVWDAAQRDGITALMPGEETAENAKLYELLQRIEDAHDRVWFAVNAAAQYMYADRDPSHLTPVQVAEEIGLTEKVMSAEYIRGIDLQYLVLQFPDFPQTVSVSEVERLRNSPDEATAKRISAAEALTLERLKAAGYVPIPEHEYQETQGPPSQNEK
jgi:hypothetical protein